MIRRHLILNLIINAELSLSIYIHKTRGDGAICELHPDIGGSGHEVGVVEEKPANKKNRFPSLHNSPCHNLFHNTLFYNTHLEKGQQSSLRISGEIRYKVKLNGFGNGGIQMRMENDFQAVPFFGPLSGKDREMVLLPWKCEVGK